MCDPRDLGVAFGEDISQGVKTYEPDLFLYDNYPGGVGQSAPLYQMSAKLLEHAAALLGRLPLRIRLPKLRRPVAKSASAAKNRPRAFWRNCGQRRPRPGSTGTVTALWRTSGSSSPKMRPHLDIADCDLKAGPQWDSEPRHQGAGEHRERGFVLFALQEHIEELNQEAGEKRNLEQTRTLHLPQGGPISRADHDSLDVFVLRDRVVVDAGINLSAYAAARFLCAI